MELDRASRKDRLQRRTQLGKGVTANQLLQARAFTGDNAHKSTSLKFIQQFKQPFTGRVIRRTHESLDALGKPIFQLQPYVEHSIVLGLAEHEINVLEHEAEELVSGGFTKGLNNLDVSPIFFSILITVVDGPVARI